MKLRFFLVSIAAVLLAAAAQGQGLKPVRDKATKLYGYQDKSKNWVIEPAYESAKRFKNGVAEVTIKPEKTKYHGVIDESGKVIVPIDCRSISFSQKERLIMAQRYSEDDILMWGVYDYDGNEIWKPSFTYAPSFYEGRGIATSAVNGLKGVIDLDGQVLIPFDNLAAERSFGEFEVLTKDFVRRRYDSHLAVTSEYSYPGYVIPYDPEGDPVRAAAWRTGPIGLRIHRNNLKEVFVNKSGIGYSATCRDLRIDWGDGRFVRLEPVVCTEEHPGSMLDPLSGKMYTVRASLYEANGYLVGDLSRWGWIESEYEEGAVYNAEDGTSWLILKDINYPSRSEFTLYLSRSRTVNHEEVTSGLGIRPYELQNMYDPSRFAERSVEIITCENAGITYRLPAPEPGFRARKAISEIHRSAIFQNRFRCGDVVNCKVRTKEDAVELELTDDLVCWFKDEFSDPSFHMDSDVPIYWGPRNDYAVFLTLRQSRSGRGLIKDDIYGTDCDYELALELYDSYDHYLQTIAEMPAIDYCSNGWIVFEKEGIAMKLRGHGNGRPERTYDTRKVTLSSTAKLPPTLSALKDAGATPGKK